MHPSCPCAHYGHCPFPAARFLNRATRVPSTSLSSVHTNPYPKQRHAPTKAADGLLVRIQQRSVSALPDLTSAAVENPVLVKIQFSLGFWKLILSWFVSCLSDHDSDPFPGPRPPLHAGLGMSCYLVSALTSDTSNPAHPARASLSCVFPLVLKLKECCPLVTESPRLLLLITALYINSTQCK